MSPTGMYEEEITKSKKRRSLQHKEQEDDDYDIRRRHKASRFFDEEAEVDTDDELEDEDDEVEEGFIVDSVNDLPEEDDCRGMPRHKLPPPPHQDDNEYLDAMERTIHDRYRKHRLPDYDDEQTTHLQQQALLPSVTDPKLWMLKCAIGRERETALCLMQNSIHKGSKLQITSAIALDHLKNYIYVEAYKEAHVRQACKGLRNMFGQKITLVPIREMTDVLSVESKAIDLASLSTLPANRKKGRFMKGDAVIVVKSELKNLKGWVEKVYDDNVHIRPEIKGLPKTVAVNEKELVKYFEPGNHVKVVFGAQEGATGMVVKVERQVLILISDSTKDHIRVFAEDVVESSEVTTGVTITIPLQRDAYGRFSGLKNPQSPKRFSGCGKVGWRHRGGRGHDGLIGATVKVRQGPYKGYRGRVIEVKGTFVEVELESQMKVVTVDRNHITDNVAVTPMHPSRTPLHPYMTPMRDFRETPIHDGMRTSVRDHAWNPYAPMSPARFVPMAS